jgi:formylglycine-generating enzyme required for sulfatase activity
MIFISYRIADSNEAVARLDNDLKNLFGHEIVFRDKTRLKPGVFWSTEIDKQLAACQVMLVVIGSIWETVKFESGKRKGYPRLDDPEDWVRREITFGLKNVSLPEPRRLKVIIPVLLNETLMPPADWLENFGLQELAGIQVKRLRTDEYGRDFEDLVALIRENCVDLPGSTPSSDKKPPPLILPDSISLYLRRLSNETAYIRLLGMGRNLQIDLPISEAYVPLQTTLRLSLEQDATERFKPLAEEQEKRIDLGQVFQQAAQRGERGVVLLGEPGSGKTTGARQIAWRLSTGGQTAAQELGLPASITPVLLRFRNLTNEMLGNKNGLRVLLEAETHCDSVKEALQNPGQKLWEDPPGGLLWILDGLDEVVDPKARIKVAEWVRKTINDRLDDWFLVTCRFQGYFREGVPLGPRFIEFHVRPLDEAQVERFIHDWFHAAYGKLLGAGPSAVERAEADCAQLLEILALPEYQLGRMRELSTNPLLLTILCIVFHQERQLPTGRAELYAHCVRVLLEHWRRGLYATYDAKAAQSVLARMAWWMHQLQDRASAPLTELTDEAARGLADVAESSGMGRDGEEFVKRTREEAGILAMSGDGAGRCGFLHLSFQEYLASDYAASENQAEFLAQHASESWWREVALLSLRGSRSYCDSFFRALLAAGVAENNADLFDRCLTEALHPVAAPFLEALRTAAGKPVGAILRLVRGLVKKMPTEERQELEQICRVAAKSSDAQSVSFAQEILSELGVSLPKIGPRTYLHQRTGITFIEIPAGEFQMGENPSHLVRLTKPFWLAKYPVTNSQYALFLLSMSAKGKKSQPDYWEDRRFNQPEQPVVGVSWDDAQAYCEWAGCRLPTEAEWEYSCRAGSEHAYCFGDDESLLGEYAWFRDNSKVQTQPVGTKKPNAWGLHDMHGNVWEWCQDWYGEYPSDVAVDPVGPKRGSYRVIRGGGWDDSAANCRAADRDGSVPAFRNISLGVRLCLSSVEPSAGGQGKIR